MRKAVFAVGRCLSVTFTYFIQTAKNIVKRLSRPSSPIIPVFLQTLIYNRGPQNPTERLQDGEGWATGRHQLAIISSGMLAVTHSVADENDGTPPPPQPTSPLATVGYISWSDPEEWTDETQSESCSGISTCAVQEEEKLLHSGEMLKN